MVVSSGFSPGIHDLGKYGIKYSFKILSFLYGSVNYCDCLYNIYDLKKTEKFILYSLYENKRLLFTFLRLTFSGFSMIIGTHSEPECSFLRQSFLPVSYFTQGPFGHARLGQISKKQRNSKKGGEQNAVGNSFIVCSGDRLKEGENIPYPDSVRPDNRSHSFCSSRLRWGNSSACGSFLFSRVWRLRFFLSVFSRKIFRSRGY